MRIAIVGFGRMGRMVYGKIVESGVHAISAVIDPYAAGPKITSRELTAAALASSDAAIDFTAPEKALENIGIYAEASIPVAIGTTGWYERMDEAKAIVERTGARIICSANFSIGVSIFLQLVSEAGRLIDKAGGYDAAIEEIHHRGKADAPSGTALMAAERLISAMHAKTGIIRGNPEGRIPDDRIGISSLRVGHVPGTHTVTLDGEDDTIEIRHTARSRSGFASGAIKAAEWIACQEPGLYTMDDFTSALQGGI